MTNPKDEKATENCGCETGKGCGCNPCSCKNCTC